MKKSVCKKQKFNNIWHEVQITSIDEVKNYNANTKTVFTAYNGNTGKQCVYWSDKKLNVGDKLQIKGWTTKEGVFIITALLRRERAK